MTHAHKKSGILASTTMIIFSVCLLLATNDADAFEVKNNLGAGFGIPFGAFGASYELELNLADWFAIGPTIGGGTTILAGGATNAGLRMHFGDKDSLFRFGISYWSGTNTIIEDTPDHYVTETGKTAGVDMRFQFGKHRSNCLDVHILKILDPDLAALEKKYGASSQGGDVKIAVGYVHRF